MDKASQSLSQTLSYLKLCSSQIIAQQLSVSSAGSAKQVNDLISLGSIELDYATKQVTELQKTLFRALHALEAGQTEVVHNALIEGIEQINHELTVPKKKHPTIHSKAINEAAADPVLAG
ncbi:hypothetical protein [Photobacterium lutimaris]|uniref:Phasin domain-containing protein n=1 Tax=Photobacterium lutimaris TaxID=388278 RepID=A0A2T3J4H2_9GAMM|nr:hypothetical protein [Photobacterium lutimaris]PSU36143.1 hypothetical protein C9I99_03820 [Photobacterium lutimaris]TDR79250.1 hypothetical protein DFP78_101766 [Photobacterium lutimaris]